MRKTKLMLLMLVLMLTLSSCHTPMIPGQPYYGWVNNQPMQEKNLIHFLRVVIREPEKIIESHKWQKFFDVNESNIKILIFKYKHEKEPLPAVLSYAYKYYLKLDKLNKWEQLTNRRFKCSK